LCGKLKFSSKGVINDCEMNFNFPLKTQFLSKDYN